MRRQRAHRLHRVRTWSGCLDQVPLVEDQRIRAVCSLERCQRLLRFRLCREPVCQTAQRCRLVRHVGCHLVLKRNSRRVTACHRQVVEQHIPQCTLAGACRIRAEWPVITHRLELHLEDLEVLARDRLYQLLAGYEDCVRIDVRADLAGDVGFTRQRQGEGTICRFEAFILRHLSGSPDETFRKLRFLLAAYGAEALDQCIREERVQRLPAGHEIAVLASKEQKIVRPLLDRNCDGRREAAVQRKCRALGNAPEANDMFALLHVDDAIVDGCTVHGRRLHVLAVFTNQAEGERNVHQALAAFRRRRRHRLLYLDAELLIFGVMRRVDRKMRRASLMVPECELRQVTARGILEGLEEVLDRCGIAIVPLDVQLHALSKVVGAENGADHSDDLRAFFIDRSRVEVVDLAVAARAHRVGEGTLVLRELMGAQRPYFCDSLDCPRTLVRGKFMVAEDRQTFLQAQLEPVAAGDAVARPVVEVFMCDDRLDIGEVGIRGGLFVGKHVLVVEDVEALVLHRPHVEVGNGDDVEDIEVIFEAEHVLVPPHGALQRVHCIGSARFLAVFDIDAERHVPPRCGDKAVIDDSEVSGHQCEQVGWLRERIVPDGKMPAIGQFACLNGIAVRQQDRCFILLRFDAHGIDAQDVGAVDEVGDAAKTFRLALRAIHIVGAIEPHQRAVARRVESRDDRQREPVGSGRVCDDKALRTGLEGRRVGRIAVNRKAHQLEFVTIQSQRGTWLHAFPAADFEFGGNQRGFWFKREGQGGRRNEVVAWPVILEPKHLPSILAHSTCSPTQHNAWSSVPIPASWSLHDTRA